MPRRSMTKAQSRKAVLAAAMGHEENLEAVGPTRSYQEAIAAMLGASAFLNRNLGDDRARRITLEVYQTIGD